MPHAHHRIEAEKLLYEWLGRIHAVSRIVDGHTKSLEGIDEARRDLSDHQDYLVELIAVGLASGEVLF